MKVTSVFLGALWVFIVPLVSLHLIISDPEHWEAESSDEKVLVFGEGYTEDVMRIEKLDNLGDGFERGMQGVYRIEYPESSQDDLPVRSATVRLQGDFGDDISWYTFHDEGFWEPLDIARVPGGYEADLRQTGIYGIGPALEYEEILPMNIPPVNVVDDHIFSIQENIIFTPSNGFPVRKNVSRIMRCSDAVQQSFFTKDRADLGINENGDMITMLRIYEHSWNACKNPRVY